jgi:hypothetical protein
MHTKAKIAALKHQKQEAAEQKTDREPAALQSKQVLGGDANNTGGPVISDAEGRLLVLLGGEFDTVRKQLADELREKMNTTGWNYDEESIFAARDNAKDFNPCKDRWLESVRAAARERFPQLVKLRRSTGIEGPAAVRDAFDLMLAAAREHCALSEVLTPSSFLDYLPPGVIPAFSDFSLRVDEVSLRVDENAQYSVSAVAESLEQVVCSYLDVLRQQALLEIDLEAAEHASGPNTLAKSTLSPQMAPPQAATVDGNPTTQVSTSAGSAEPPLQIAPRNEFMRSGDGWTLSFDGTKVLLQHSVGLGYLKELIRCQGRAISADILVTLNSEGALPSNLGAAAELDTQNELDQPLSDGRTRRQVDERLRELAALLATAEQNTDPEAIKLNEEIEKLQKYRKSITGIMHKPRSFPTRGDRNRVSVTQAIDRAINQISKRHEALGGHLRGEVQTGTECMYRDTETVWSV